VGRSTKPGGSRHFQRLAGLMGDDTITEHMVKHAYRSGIGPPVTNMKDVANPEALKAAADHYRSILGTDNSKRRSMRDLWGKLNADPRLITLWLAVLGRPVIPEYVYQGYADHLRDWLAEIPSLTDDEASSRTASSLTHFSNETGRRSAEGHLNDDPTYALHDSQVRRRAQTNLDQEIEQAAILGGHDGSQFINRIERQHELALANREILLTHRAMSLASMGHPLPSGEDLEGFKADLIALLRDTHPAFAGMLQHADPERLGRHLADIPNKVALVDYLDTHRSIPDSVITDVGRILVPLYVSGAIPPTNLEPTLVELTAQMLHEYLSNRGETNHLPGRVTG